MKEIMAHKKLTGTQGNTQQARQVRNIELFNWCVGCSLSQKFPAERAKQISTPLIGTKQNNVSGRQLQSMKGHRPDHVRITGWITSEKSLLLISSRDDRDFDRIVEPWNTVAALPAASAALALALCSRKLSIQSLATTNSN
jgi:hypothetical protein